MNSQVRIRRSRGAVCAVALILLGLWGGLAPFAGHYIHFGYTPDKAWGYTTGRLYLSAIPGGVAVLGGLALALTRSRVVGVVGSVLAAVAGAWFVVGAGSTLYLLKKPGISPGVPLDPGTVKGYLETLALFSGVGALIIFAAAVGCGRVSILAARDAADAADMTYYPDYEGEPASQPDPAAYPATQFQATTTGQFPAVRRFPDATTDPFPEQAAGQFPTAAGQFPPSERFTQPSSLPAKSPPFSDAPNPYVPEAPA